MNESRKIRIWIPWIIAVLLVGFATGDENGTCIFEGPETSRMCDVSEEIEIDTAETIIASPVDLNVRSFRILRNNNVRFIPLNLAVFPNLETVTVLDCIVSSVYENQFQGLVNVRDINLHNNVINEIAPNAFRDQMNLEKLILSDNVIGTLDQNVFKSLTKLRFLNLEDNYIEELHPNVFDPLINLVTLRISDNRIRSLDGNVFLNLVELSDLQLYYNKLSELPMKLLHLKATLLSIVPDRIL